MLEKAHAENGKREQAETMPASRLASTAPPCASSRDGLMTASNTPTCRGRRSRQKQGHRQLFYKSLFGNKDQVYDMVQGVVVRGQDVVWRRFTAYTKPPTHLSRKCRTSQHVDTYDSTAPGQLFQE
jgi:hypothetical protein